MYRNYIKIAARNLLKQKVYSLINIFGLAIAIALIIIVVNAAFTGALLPFLLRRIQIDPAVATSPFITTVNDVLGLVIYFGTITLFLRWF